MWPDWNSNPGSLAYRWSTLPLSYQATCRPVTFFPCLIRFVPESARNHTATDETVSFTDQRVEHGPTLATKCHRGGKITWPDQDSNPGSLAYRASTLPLSYRATCLPVTFSPYLIRYVPESAQNHAGTDETVSFRLLHAARARTNCGHHMPQGRKMNVARPGIEPRVYSLPCEHSTTELPSHTIDRLHFSSA